MSRAQIEILLARLLAQDKILLTTHRTPDPDGLGAELGLQNLLQTKNKDVLIINSEPLPVKMRFLDPEHRALDMKSLKDKSCIDGRTIVIVDNSDLARIDQLQQYVRPDKSNFIIIDHHDGMQGDSHTVFAFPETGSSCEIVCELFDAAQVPITESVCIPLYAGIAADTGNFKYRKTSPRTHEVAARLMEFGLNPAEIAERLFEQSPLARLLLKKRLYANMVIEQGRLAYFKVRMNDVIELGLSLDDLDGVVNELVESDDIQAGLLFTERAPGQTKVSVRSRGSVNMLASVTRYGGGGHKNACGATIPMDLESAIVDFIPEALRCLDSV